MLTTIHFNRMSNAEKYALIEDCGTYLEVYRKDDNLKICLFALFNFYVEIFYNQTDGRLIAAIAFNSHEKLDQYLHHIDLTEVYAVL